MVPNNLLAQVAHPLPDITGPGIDPNKFGNPIATLEKIISNVIAVISIVAVIYFVLQIIFAGYAILSSNGDMKKIESSRDRLTQAILGLFVVIIAIFLGALIASLLGIQSPFDLTQLANTLGIGPKL